MSGPLIWPQGLTRLQPECHIAPLTFRILRNYCAQLRDEPAGMAGWRSSIRFGDNFFHSAYGGLFFESSVVDRGVNPAMDRGNSGRLRVEL